MKKIKVLVVDDSAIVRDVLSKELAKDNEIEVIGAAPDPYIARDKIVRLKPDVLTLDIEMPRMDGLTFLDKLMTYFPMPVIIVSSITKKDSLAAIKALELGAFDVVNKPGESITIEEVKDEILSKIKLAYENKDVFLGKWKILNKERESKPKKYYLSELKTTDKLIAIGASTGGTVALEYIFKSLPRNLPPIVVVQHMPTGFTYQFARRLNELSELDVKEAEEDEMLEIGHVYIAKGGIHLKLVRKGEFLYNSFDNSDKVNFQKPSVDVLFDSVAQVAAKNTLAILLTGMGKDGANGLLKIKEAGGYTIAQDEKTSVVWGMPKVAIDIGAAMEVLSLDSIIAKIVSFVNS